MVCAETNTHSDGIPRLPLPRLAEDSFTSPVTTLHVLTDEALHRQCGTRIAFTQRAGGVSPAPYKGLNLSYDVGDIDACVDMNRRMLCETLGAELMVDNLVSFDQVHGTNILVIEDPSQIEEALNAQADGVVCSGLDIPALALAADCAPIILVAPGGAFAIIHAGWRGALAGIPGKGLDALIKATGSISSEVNCYIGPHIRECCYEVSSDLLKGFVQEYGHECDAGGGHLNLSAAIIVSLLRAGAVPDRIVEANLCTSCRTDLFYSYRGEGGTCGRHGAFAFREEITWDE